VRKQRAEHEKILDVDERGPAERPVGPFSSRIEREAHGRTRVSRREELSALDQDGRRQEAKERRGHAAVVIASVFLQERTKGAAQHDWPGTTAFATSPRLPQPTASRATAPAASANGEQPPPSAGRPRAGLCSYENATYQYAGQRKEETMLWQKNVSGQSGTGPARRPVLS